MEAATNAPPPGATQTANPEQLRPSPFQPRARPSDAAIQEVRDAIEHAGSLSALLDEGGAKILAKLSPEARALAELAADVQANGVETPLEVRHTPTGPELLSGHRRRTAALLAGLSSVPIIDRGPLPDDEASAIVGRRNLLRADLTTWQEARVLERTRRERERAGKPTSVRTMAKVFGYSHGKAGDLLKIVDAFLPHLEEIGGGDEVRADVGLSRFPFRVLRRLAQVDDVAHRIQEARRRAGLGNAAPVEARPAAPPTRAAPVLEHRPRRGGGMVLTLLKDPERMSQEEAAEALRVVRELTKALQKQARR